MRPHRWLLAVVRLIVPRAMRDEWTREWDAELNHRESRLRALRPPTVRDHLRLLRETTGAAWDALWLRTSRWQTLRSLRRHVRVSGPVFFSLAAAMAALIAAAGLYEALLLRPPGIQEPKRVLAMSVQTPTGRAAFSPDDLAYFREHGRSFSGFAAFPMGISTMAAPDLQDRLVSMGVSENYFELLGIRPLLGTLTFPAGAGAPKDRIVISEFLWKKMGADRNIVGRPFQLERATVTIMGVAPASFTGMNWVWRTDVWYPFTASARLDGRPEVPFHRTDRGLLMLGRLAPGVSDESAQAEIAGISARLAAAYPDTDKDRKPFLEAISTIPPDERGWIASILAALVGLAFMTLVAAGANAMNLLLGLALSRRHEMLVRTALGASRAQLMSPLLRESTAIALAAGVVGFAAAYAALSALSAHGVSLGPDFPGLTFDVRPGVWFAAIVALAVLITGVGIGLAPAWRAASDGISGALHRELLATGTARQRLRGVLVIAQTTVATAVLVGVGVSWRSASNLRHVDLGFSARNLLAAETSLDLGDRDAGAAVAFHDRLVTALGAVPGVESVSFASGMPIESCCEQDVVRSEDGAESSRAVVPYAVVDDAFFSTMGINVLAGRTFGPADTRRSPEVIVVNQLLARSRWPNEDPIGRRLRIENGNRLVTVVGVVADGKYTSADAAPSPIIYFDWRQHHGASVATIVRTAGDPRTARRAVRAALASIDPDIKIWSLRTLQEDLDLALLLPSLMVSGLTGLGTFALLLTAVGLYATVFYSIGQRRKEIGIRVAMGAQPRDVVGIVLRQALWLGGLGAVGGLAVSQLALPIAGSVFYGIRPIEAGILAAVGGFSLFVTLAVALVAARPWMRVSAIEILRST